ncbi:hypothetical protein [Streptomyces sp. NRRL B-24572]|uniref:hypothetical protein n=1 Tax=Streptomyces sp. NRRL B-24572 TaxID=1962156 RepID=UPI000A398DB4|nr:hypothetical protein [Streptomyces sp. NRRL B-24572]
MFHTIVTEALTAAGVPSFIEEDEDLLIAHRPGTTADKAVYAEQVAVTRYHSGKPGFLAMAYEPDGLPDYAEIGTVFDAPRGDVHECARAVAEWFAEPRPTAGGVLLAALAERGINAHSDDIGMSYAIPFDPTPPAADVRNGLHLTVGDRNPSVEHVPAAHTGWTLFLHDQNGEPVGNPLFTSGDGETPVDCAADSAAVADIIASVVNRPAA